MAQSYHEGKNSRWRPKPTKTKRDWQERLKNIRIGKRGVEDFEKAEKSTMSFAIFDENLYMGMRDNPKPKVREFTTHSLWIENFYCYRTHSCLYTTTGWCNCPFHNCDMMKFSSCVHAFRRAGIIPIPDWIKYATNHKFHHMLYSWCISSRLAAWVNSYQHVVKSSSLIVWYDRHQ